MPARNCARYLAESIESVLSQPVRDLEIVVHDDASEDGAEAAVRACGDRRVRFARHARQIGIPANRNSLLAAARGDLILWLDGDDRLLPGALESLLAAMDAAPGVGLVHGAFDVIAGDGRALPPWPMPFDRDVVEHGPSAFAELAISNYITAPVLVRRACHERAGPYATGIGPSSTDWDMWLRIALEADLAYVARPLAQYRQHGGSITAVSHRPGTRLACDTAAIAHVFARCADRIPGRDAVHRRARLALLAKAVLFARDAVARSDWLLARDAFERHEAAAALCGAETAGVTAAIRARSEIAFHRQSGALLARLADALAGSRFGNRLRRATGSDGSWERALERIAGIVRQVVPPDARVAAVDKWDPTLLHLADRAGCHFPDRRAMPDGYPPDSEGAIAHLEILRTSGAGYLVFPSAAFWWLQHYEGLARHLETRYEAVWRDDDCVIYRLSGRAA
jgi:hypothetical protein